MAFVPVPKDLNRVKTKVMFNLTIDNYITNTRRDKEKIRFLATNVAFRFILQ